MTAVVIAVSRSPKHTFSKPNQESILLVAGLGVDGDAHQGATTRHRYQVARDPGRPNLRQVHLIHAELFDELAQAGFTVAAGHMGENITTRGVSLIDLSTGARLYLGEQAVVRVTGLRSPCKQIDAFQPGLMAAVLDRNAQGSLVRKLG